jgi:hypothetical protein
VRGMEGIKKQGAGEYDWDESTVEGRVGRRSEGGLSESRLRVRSVD